MVCCKKPPLVTSVLRVVILIVPPKDGMITLDAPKPRCTCIEVVTSVKPDQFDQNIEPFSISLTGIPLMVNATLPFFEPLEKPRMLIRESPKPPPCAVAIIPGVPCNNWGISPV